MAARKRKQPRCQPSLPPMSGNDSEDMGQTNAGAFKIILAMKPLKQSEQIVIVLHVETDTIVSDRKNVRVCILCAGDGDLRSGLITCEFQGI
jgi:hypothetical protein